MAMKRALALLLLLLPLSVQAQERRLTATEFQELVSGRTLSFDRHGKPFGAEQYFPDKRVIWAFEDGTCQFGIWFDNADGQICFAYEGGSGSICWDFSMRSDGVLTARSEGSAPENDLSVSANTPDPIDCPLPDIGT